MKIIEFVLRNIQIIDGIIDLGNQFTIAYLTSQYKH